MMTLALTGALLSCSKDKDENCTYTTSDGTYFGPTPPTQQQIKEWEDACSCDITVQKTCN